MRNGGSKFLRAILLLAALPILSCAATRRPLCLEGDGVRVELLSGAIRSGELIVVADSALVVRNERKPWSAVSSATPETSPWATIGFDEIHAVTVEGFQDRSWMVPLFLFELAPLVILGVVASNEDADATVILGPGAGLIALNTLLFEFSTPSPPKVEGPITINRAAFLKKYARFPAGLTRNQLETLLAAPPAGGEAR